MIYTEKQLWRVKRITVGPVECDEQGTPYTQVTVVFRWWYRPIAWLSYLLSRRIEK